MEPQSHVAGKTSWLRWKLPALVLIVLVAAVCFFPRHEGTSLPPSLGSLKRAKELRGNEATEIIDKMHGKGVTAKENVIAVYSAADGNAVVYLSVYGSEKEATEARERMAARIRNGNETFGQYQSMTVEGWPVSFCLGLGQAHFFFSHGESLYWLAVDISCSSPTARELVRHVVHTSS